MNNVVSPQPRKTLTLETTLFDLISAMQQQATTPLAEALIVPTIVDLLRSGRIKFEGGRILKAVA